MSRKRILSDEQILEAAVAVMARTGPSDFTLAAVGNQIGLAPATLLQRFGSKRGLLLAVAAWGASGTEGQFEAALAEAKSPLRGLLDLFAGCAGFIGKPEEVANHLGFLQMDLSDPEFHAHMLTNTQASLNGAEKFLRAAVKSNEIHDCDVKRLARTVSVVYQGALIVWCVLRKGDAGKFVRKELEAVLDPYLVRSK
jgi:AcrR family transcriptional regulator